MWCHWTGTDNTPRTLAGASVRIMLRPSVNDQYEKSFYHPNRSPSPLIRVWVIVCRCERIVEGKNCGFKLYTMNPKVRSALVLVPLPNQ